VITSTIDEARSQLAELITAAQQGEEVVIARAGKPVARLLPYEVQGGPRQGGQWHGHVRIAPDFDVLPPDIGEAFGLNEPGIFGSQHRRVRN
jgi:prevent-host-death family protein